MGEKNHEHETSFQVKQPLETHSQASFMSPPVIWDSLTQGNVTRGANIG